jgi:hypothetical protein
MEHTITISKEMLDFFIRTMEFKKKRLLSWEVNKNFSTVEQIGEISVQFGEDTQEERKAHADRRAEWELKMNRTERAIDILHEANAMQERKVLKFAKK